MSTEFDDSFEFRNDGEAIARKCFSILQNSGISLQKIKLPTKFKQWKKVYTENRISYGKIEIYIELMNISKGIKSYRFIHIKEKGDLKYIEPSALFSFK